MATCLILMNVAAILALLIFAATAAALSTGRDVATRRNRTVLVDTRIGSGGFGFGIGEINPGPSMPFGCMRLGPDTSIGLEPLRIPFQTYAGYAYDSSYVECFSHTHVVGAGLGDYQNFGVMVTRQWTDATVQNEGYRSLYAHDQEVALPGYYAVELLSHNTYAELTVSGTHAGMHRYTCRSDWPEPTTRPCVALVDVCHGYPGVFGSSTKQCKLAQIFNITSTDGGLTYELDAFMRMAGSFSRGAVGGSLPMYFHAVVSAFVVDASGATTPVALSPQTWVDGSLSPDGSLFTNATETGSLGVGFTPATVQPTNSSNAPPAVQFLVRSGLSFVSSANARLNLNAQQRNSDGMWLTFEDAVEVSVDAWETILSSVTRSGGSDEWHERVFDAALYRAHLPPSTYSEANGEYMGLDNQVHTLKENQTRHLSDLSIWDIYRTQTPMLLWTKPDAAADLANSMLEAYSITHQLPKWIFANIETGCMVGLHSAVIFADYASKNLTMNADPAALLEILVEGVAQQNQRMAQYGYVTANSNSEGASNTQDYSVDAGAVHYLATIIGNQSIADAFAPYAKMYRNVWDNVSSFFCPRFENGSFWCPNPLLTYPFENSYTEGDGWQYRWYAPQDVAGLVQLFPSVTAFVDDLYDFFELSYLWPLNTTLPNPYFWAGNEPDLQTPMLFNWAGNEYAYLTSEIFPQLLDTYYFPYAAGTPGNDDYGAMSAWCFWGYVGVFPMVPSDEYALFAPRFDAIDFTLSSGELQLSPWRHVVAAAGDNRTTTVSIRCYGRPSSGVAYVANISLNGRPLSTPIVTHTQLLEAPNQRGEATLLEYYLVGEPTVFGNVPPSAGGPAVHKPSRRGSSGLFEHVEMPSKDVILQLMQRQQRSVMQRMNFHSTL